MGKNFYKGGVTGGHLGTDITHEYAQWKQITANAEKEPQEYIATLSDGYYEIHTATAHTDYHKVTVNGEPVVIATEAGKGTEMYDAQGNSVYSAASKPLVKDVTIEPREWYAYNCAVGDGNTGVTKKPSVNYATFFETVGEAGDYVFEYADDAWTLDGEAADIATYGIDLDGQTPENGDIITVSVVEDSYTVTFTAGRINKENAVVVLIPFGDDADPTLISKISISDAYNEAVALTKFGDIDGTVSLRIAVQEGRVSE